MRYGPSRHFAAVAKKEKAATSKVGWRRQYREESLPPPLHQEKETFCGDGSSKWHLVLRMTF